MEMDDGQRCHLGPRDNPQLRLGYREQRTLRTHDEARHVEVAAANELVEVVSGHAPLYLGVAGENFVAVFVADGKELAVDIGLEAVAPQLSLQLVARQRLEMGGVPVGEDHVHLLDVVDCLSPEDGVRAAGVVAECAADVAAVAGARVRRKEHVRGAYMVVELVEDYSGLHADPTLFRVDFDDVTHVLREVHDDGMAHGLARQAGAASPWQHGDLVAVGGLHDGDHVLGIPRDDHPDGLDLVEASVGAVEHPGHLVEADLARHEGFQVLDQRSRICLCCLNGHGAPLA